MLSAHTAPERGSKGFTAIAKQLIEALCNVDLQQNDGATPLYMAAFFGHLQITEQLIEARANLYLEHKNGYTPLMISAYNGHKAVAMLLLAARSNIDVQAVDLDNAIIGAVGIDRLHGSCKGRLGVWLHEGFQRESADEEEEEEEDSSNVQLIDSVEKDESRLKRKRSPSTTSVSAFRLDRVT